MHKFLSLFTGIKNPSQETILGVEAEVFNRDGYLYISGCLPRQHLENIKDLIDHREYSAEDAEAKSKPIIPSTLRDHFFYETNLTLQNALCCNEIVMNMFLIQRQYSACCWVDLNPEDRRETAWNCGRKFDVDFLVTIFLRDFPTWGMFGVPDKNNPNTDLTPQIARRTHLLGAINQAEVKKLKNEDTESLSADYIENFQLQDGTNGLNTTLYPKYGDVMFIHPRLWRKLSWPAGFAVSAGYLGLENLKERGAKQDPQRNMANPTGWYMAKEGLVGVAAI